jgi:uncharacterized protein YukE
VNTIKVDYDRLSANRNIIREGIAEQEQIVNEIFNATSQLSSIWHDEAQINFQTRINDFKARSEKYRARVGNFSEKTYKLAGDFVVADESSRLLS